MLPLGLPPIQDYEGCAYSWAAKMTQLLSISPGFLTHFLFTLGWMPVLFFNVFIHGHFNWKSREIVRFGSWSHEPAFLLLLIKLGFLLVMSKVSSWFKSLVIMY